MDTREGPSFRPTPARCRGEREGDSQPACQRHSREVSHPHRTRVSETARARLRWGRTCNPQRPSSQSPVETMAAGSLSNPSDADAGRASPRVALASNRKPLPYSPRSPCFPYSPNSQPAKAWLQAPALSDPVDGQAPPQVPAHPRKRPPGKAGRPKARAPPGQRGASSGSKPNSGSGFWVRGWGRRTPPRSNIGGNPEVPVNPA